MPEIEPFRGILYDTAKVEASKVLAPPYDVIDDAGRAALESMDPHNCVRLILPQGEGDAKYGAANQTLNAWLADGALIRDTRPAIYRYHQVFTVDALGGRSFTRRGFVAAVRLHSFDEGVILPHERTLAGPKVDRLKLMEATSAHFSQIFTLYSDPSKATDDLFRKVESTTPDVDGVTDDGTRHRVWRVPDRELIGKLQRLMGQMKLYIADGHHRYETMLALRESFRKRVGGELSFRSSAKYGTLFCANMDDAGLVVLPTHRLVHDLASFDFAVVREKASRWFEIIEIPGAAGDATRLATEIHDRSEVSPTFAAIVPGSDSAWLMTLRGSANLAAEGLSGSRALLDLDITLLHALVLERVLGIDRKAQEAKTNIHYIRDTPSALQRTAAGEGQVCFILEPTRLKQIRAVADAHEFMPQKSTYFYPKIASGVVFNRIDPNEDL